MLPIKTPRPLLSEDIADYEMRWQWRCTTIGALYTFIDDDSFVEVVMLERLETVRFLFG